MKMSHSASAENLSVDGQNSGGDSNMCLELALEGERLCKEGDCRTGVAFFQAAIQAGTDDLRTLSAIYSQLGNAYFYLGDYVKAMQYHNHDLTLARTMGDKLGEAKSSGNLGNTLKVMGKFDEATICCKRHLEISRELGDKLSEGRALYNLGNVYHAKGKQIGRVGQQDPGEFPEDVRQCLQEAVHYYEENLKLMRELSDTAAQGRACGNLGNTFYLLGDFQQAIHYHNERLKIAREFGDKAAERRANSNLGNSHIFLGEFEKAAQHYKRTLVLAQELRDRAVEAQACYSLGNTYTLLRDYQAAVDYHLRHLSIAQQLMDRVGEGRACWSLGNAYSAMGNHEKALHFASLHLNISKELNDPMGQATAQMNVTDLKKLLGLEKGDGEAESGNGMHLIPTSKASAIAASSPGRYRLRRQSMDNLDLIKLFTRTMEPLTPDGKQKDMGEPLPARAGIAPQPSQEEEEESFFELLSRFQSGRMDDQRCVLNANQKPRPRPRVATPEKEKEGEDLLELIAGMQSKRMDEQRVTLPCLPGLNTNRNNQSANRPPPQPIGQEADDSFIEMLVRCQGSRLEDQRSPLPAASTLHDAEEEQNQRRNGNTPSRTTVPEEDLFALIQRLQAGRMEDQRASGPAKGH
ncbi:G-protein-signaling modulator 2 isoform X1 [Neodiprion lecontei]|uniref:G-protein-signaling modulator 2 isoform X1 n=1 Tax=Neodiprion lecontei TaxID=441921 RepID=A0A6J0C348_NEOLC|nr:G-protein-signaling modulator 2 isoform X1 [Neodiprion lecontei]